MKVTYSSSIGNSINISSVASRVLTENLRNMDTHFSTAIMTISYFVLKDLRESKIEKLRVIEQYYMRLLRAIYSHMYKDEFLNTIKGDYLLYSMSSTIHDYNLVSHALNNGVSVVAGGTEIGLYGFDEVRRKFVTCGTDEKMLKNLMLVNGYVNQHTNMKSLIEKWRDVVLPKEDLSDIIFDKGDYTKTESMQQIKRIIDRIDSEVFKIYIWPEVVSVIFDSKCYWSKCRFCDYCSQANVNFIKDLSIDTVVMAIMDICNNLDCYNVAINDDYFIFTPQNTEIIKKLKSNRVNLICQTGVQLLKNEEYTRKLCEYFDIFSFGLEHATDFGLMQLNKGYGWNEAKTAFHNIKKYYNNNLITANIIMDTPVNSVAQANLNYRRLLEVKRELENERIKFSYTPVPLNILTPKMFYDFSSLGRIRKPKENRPSGKYMVLKEIENLPDYVYLSGVPFERIDKDGNLLPSDIEIVDREILEQVMDQKFFYSLLNEERK